MVIDGLDDKVLRQFVKTKKTTESYYKGIYYYFLKPKTRGTTLSIDQ